MVASCMLVFLYLKLTKKIHYTKVLILSSV